jgi:hypothetical protein
MSFALISPRHNANLSQILKDSLPIQVWLSLGAVLNGALILLIGRIALIIPVGILLSRLVNALLIANGLKANPWKAGSVPGKTSAQLPNPDGTYGPKPGSQGISVLIIGTRSNHPLGLFAPGFKQLGDYMARMQKDVNRRAEEYGLLNSSLYVGAERSTGNELTYIMYFRNPEGIHKYAHDDLHREAWVWYNKAATTTDLSHMTIFHEIFHSPAGNWETLYANSAPTLLGGARVPVKGPNGTEYASTLVDASRGLLKSSKGRMARTNGDDNASYGEEPFLRNPDEEKFDF